MKPIQLVPSKQAQWFGPLMIAGGIASIVLGLWIFATTETATIWGRLLQSSIPSLVGALLAFGGHMLTCRRGGISVTEDHIILYGESEADRLQVPLERLTALYVHPIVEQWGDETHESWHLEAVLADAPRILLGVSTDEHELKHFGHTVASAAKSGVPIEQLASKHYSAAAPLDNPPACVDITDSSVSFVVGARGNMNTTLMYSGLSMLIVSSLLLIDIENNNVFGFLFGPLLLVLGLLLTGLPIVKRQLIEHMAFNAKAITHSYEFLGFQWGHREIPMAADAYVRIRQRGLLGANLELVSDGQIKHIAGSVRSKTNLSHPDLVWLGQHVSSRLNHETHSK